MTLQEIEHRLRQARCAVFSEDENLAQQAGDLIKRLLIELSKHPEEINRKNALKAKQDEDFLRRWM